MASFGRLTNSIVSAVNENSLSLANLNFDFSLVTVQAPPEYAHVGSSLATRRRDDAESGTAHRTARKLGALFESIIPQTPLLVSAYGTRASQIMETPGLNPIGSAQRHGPFVDWIGADATSIWAAATSGNHCIAMHLLACILVRAFEDPAVTTSIWAELVARRQSVIEEMTKASFTVAQFAAINAASQQFPREELRQWDANIRAWMLSADTAMIKEHKQLQLIIKNLSIPVSGGGTSMYTEVTNTWKQAMTGLERLLAGEPQCITNGGILLAISSWHLYPTLMVLGNQVKMVMTNDSLLSKAGIITIGITRKDSGEGSSTTDEHDDGIYWSVSLSHYRYYGRPVEVIGKAGDRLRIDELHLVTLGSLFGSWGVSRRDPLPAARWVVALWNCVNRVTPLLNRPSWLNILADAAKRLIVPEITPAAQHLRALVDFGSRRHRTFMGTKVGEKTTKGNNMRLPWFGLRSTSLLESLSKKKPSGGISPVLESIGDVRPTWLL